MVLLLSRSSLLACVHCQRSSPDFCPRWLCCIPLSLPFCQSSGLVSPSFFSPRSKQSATTGCLVCCFVSSVAVYHDYSPSLESLTFSSFISVVLEWFSCWNVLVGSFSFRIEAAIISVGEVILIYSMGPMLRSITCDE